MGHKHFYEFGRFRIDVGLSRLDRGDETVPLPPKAFDLLLFLARNTERVISKTELMESLWPNTFVEEANLTQHVYTLRKALGDRPDGSPYIETVPRRGYRLAADVREVLRGRSNTTAAAPEIVPQTAATDRQVFEGERKRTTVMHGAIANAADVAEQLGAVEMHRLNEQLIAVAEDEVSRYGGVLTETRSAEFVALFGAREVHEDDARRAILASLAIERRVAQLGTSPLLDEDRLAIKIGITTGSLVVNRVTNQDHVGYVAVGEALQLAGLLQQLAGPGSVVISDATERAVTKQVRTEPAGRIGNMAVFRVVDISAHGSPLAQALRTLAPFVGRIHESALLQALFTQAVAGQGQVVNVVGEPGMGKSRLVYEATRAMVSNGGSVSVLEGRCVSYGSLIPYLPLIDVLRAHCEVGEGDPPEAIERAIDRVVRDNALPRDAGAWLLRLVGIVNATTAGEALSPEAIKARTFDALKLMFLKAAARRPLVMVVEDVHWIDSTSEEFLTALIGQLVATRILLIATHRPGYRPPWMDRSYVTQLIVAPLGAADSARLVQSVTGDTVIATDVSSAILQRGEGNPFFLEELARTVVEHGAAATFIPDTVQGVIMARLDRLTDRPKRLLQTAAVLGREVPLKLLSRVWDDTAPFDAEISELCRQEFLYERPGADEASYVFKHALTQDVAYDSLLARRRRDLHLTAARALEEHHRERLDDVAATLAYHYARTDLTDEAVTWLLRAADRAARVYANTEAILHLDLAARRVQRLPEGADRDRRMLEVALRHAHSLYFLGRFRESVDVLLPHAARVARLNDTWLAASYAFWLGHMYSRLGDQRRAADSANRAIEAATRAGDAATLGKAHGVLALEGHWSGNTAEGIEHGEEAVRLLTPLPDQRWWLGMAHFYLAINYLLTADFDLALFEAARADAVGREIGDPRLRTYAGYTTGWIELSRGNAAVAVAACRQSLQRAPDRVSRAYASLFLCYALLETGEHGPAGERLAGTLQELEGFAFPQWHSLAAILMGEVERRSGRLDQATRWTACGTDIARRVNYRYAIQLGERIATRIAEDQSG